MARVAKGLASPTTRPRYVAEARRRLTRHPRRREGAERCLVCGAPGPRRSTVRFAKDNAKVCHVHICRLCGYISNPENTNDYAVRENIDSLPTGTRIGTDGRPGREYHMAKMATDILARGDLEVLVYGAGRSLDNHHIEKLPRVSHVAIGDIMKLRDDAEFIDANKPAPRRFPVVIASEVIEHFRNPPEDFATLFKFVERDGLVVCGTNIYDGGDLSKDPYLFFSDHTSYYTPQALRTIANAGAYHIDFRAPLVGTAMRKRYVLFTKSRRVLEDVACYFGSQMYAPSEGMPTKKQQPARKRRAQQRGAPKAGNVRAG